MKYYKAPAMIIILSALLLSGCRNRSGNMTSSGTATTVPTAPTTAAQPETMQPQNTTESTQPTTAASTEPTSKASSRYAGNNNTGRNSGIMENSTATNPSNNAASSHMRTSFGTTANTK